MKTLFITLIFFVTSVLSIQSQTVAPFVFGDEYRNIKDMDVYGNIVAVISVNDAISPGETRPIHLAIYENEQWNLVPPFFINSGVQDTVQASPSPKMRIAPNGDIWIAGKYLYKYSNQQWKKYVLIESDTSITERTYELIQITNDDKLLVFCETNGSADIFTVDLDDFDLQKRDKKYKNEIISPNTNYPYESVFYIDGYTFSQKARYSDPNIKEHDFWVNTPDDTILQFTIPSPKGEKSGRGVMQIFAKNKNEIWVLTDLSLGKVNSGTPYNCCAGIYLLKNLKDWEVISNAESYPFNLTNGLNIPVIGIHKINENLYEFMLGRNNANQMSNEMYLYNKAQHSFIKTNWDTIVKNSIGFRASNNLLTEYKLAHILEAFSKNEKSIYLETGHEFVKFKVDGNGNRWFMSRSFVLKTPPIMHPTSVTETDITQLFRIVPNPATNTITIKGKTELLKEIEILNLRGETLIKVDGEFNNISIRPFANGVYFVRKIFKDGSQEFSKFVKE